jgi:hypothetical protein
MLQRVASTTDWPGSMMTGVLFRDT